MAVELTYQDLTQDHESLDLVVRWLHGQWGSVNGDSAGDIRTQLLAPSDSPPSQIAMIEAEPVGFVWINRHKLAQQNRPQLWINGLFVPEPHRRKGIASSLVVRAESLAVDYEEVLFVYTDIPDLYLRLGWKTFKREDPHGSSTLVKQL